MSKEISQGIVRATGESYVSKDGQGRVKFVTIGEAFEAKANSRDGARCEVRLKLLPFPQINSKGKLQCWLHIFPDAEPPEHDENEKFKLTGIVLSGGLQIGAEFSSPSGRRTLKLDALPTKEVLRIHDIKPKKENADEGKRT